MRITMSSSSSSKLSSVPLSSLSNYGRIRRVRILGKGSYGVVYLAYLDPDEDRLFAMKSAVEGSSEASALAKEKRVYKAFEGCPGFTVLLRDFVTRHPEVGFNLYNLVLQYAPAGSLRYLIAETRGHGFEESELKSFARDLLVGLSALHSRNYVHCDLKPGNILAFPKFEGSYELKLADFGAAKEPHEELLSQHWKGLVRGTRLYMSPESLRDGVISWEMDIWSLGCVILQMITGRDSPWPTMIDHLTTPVFQNIFNSPSMIEPLEFAPQSISEAGRDFLSKCLDTNPATRWPAIRLLSHPYVAVAPNPSPFESDSDSSTTFSSSL